MAHSLSPGVDSRVFRSTAMKTKRINTMCNMRGGRRL